MAEKVVAKQSGRASQNISRPSIRRQSQTCKKCGGKITPDYGHCHKEGGCHEPRSRVCPPLSEELRRRIEAAISENSNLLPFLVDAEAKSAIHGQLNTLTWLLREADSLSPGKQK